MQQPLGMVLPLGIARDLGADHARRVVVVFGAVHASDRALVEKFDLQRTGRRAVMRTGLMAYPRHALGPQRLIHRVADYRRTPIPGLSDRAGSARFRLAQPHASAARDADQQHHQHRRA